MDSILTSSAAAVFSQVLAEGEFIAAVGATLAGEPIILAGRGPLEGRPRFRYRIYTRDEKSWVAVDLEDPGVSMGTQFVARLSQGRWLVAAGSGAKRRETAFVFDAVGKFVSSFDPGHDPQRLASTEDGQIWIGYGEEPTGPIDDGGIVALDEEGNVLFAFNPIADRHELPSVFDCYALNATRTDEVWACYYTDFPLVRIRGHELVEIHKEQPVSGASAMAIGEGTVLFAGAWGFPQGVTGKEVVVYSQPYESPPHVFRLLDLESYRFRDMEIAFPDGELFDTGKHPPGAMRFFARASRLFLRRPDGLFVVDVKGLRTT